MGIISPIMKVAPPFEVFEQTLITHAQRLYVQYLKILFSSFGEEDFQMFCIKLTMFKLFLTIISLIMYVAPPLEQSLIRHNPGLFVCNI